MIYFITENYIKTNTPLQNNVDVSKIDYLFSDSYDLVISDLLGTYFGGYLLDKHQLVIAWTDTYTADEEKLIDKVQKTMAWHIAHSAVETLSDGITNKGAQKGYGDYSNASTDGQVRFLSEKYKKRFEAFQQQLINYLTNDKDLFPNFISDLNKSSLILRNCASNSDVRDLGMMFGRVRSNRRCNEI